ncbi:MAG: glycerate kinase type-2 family protein [Longimicrobiales bacterium]
MTAASPASASERAAHARLILSAAVAAADPAPAVRSAILGVAADLRNARGVYLLAIGKAAAGMARAALGALPRLPDAALVVVPRGAGVPVDGARVLQAAHPVPDATSVHAAREAESLLSRAGSGDIVLVLLSGGTSSLCAAPIAGLTIGQYADVVSALLRAGADIRELNTVRSHIDRLKGGAMARLIAPARALGLVVSDVVGNPLDIIASGPLVSPSTTPGDAIRVLESYGLSAADVVRRALTRTADAGAAPMSHVDLRVIVDNTSAVSGAAAAALDLGYEVNVGDMPVTGPARDAGSRIARQAIAVAQRLVSGAMPVCMLSGGETTVTVSGAGIGGRNQELVLAAAIELAGVQRITVASLGTDGVDGPTDAAGAIADGATVARAAAAGSDAALALHNNDSYSFFAAAGGLIRTGPTGTNVMDVQVALVSAES